MSRLTTHIEERMETMQNLMEEVLTLQKDGERSGDTMIRVREIVDESGRLVEQSEEPPEMVIDSNILATSIHLVRSHVHAFDTNLTSFSPEEYTSGIVTYVETTARNNWDSLAVDICSFFKKVPTPTYMLGTFVLDPPPPPERAERQKKSAEAKKSCVTAVGQVAQDQEPADEVYKHIMKCLVEQYRKSGKTPINFLEFVADPQSYWNTVENIFHFAFLVRDEMVKMSLDEKGVSVVQPVIKKPDEQAKRKNVQFFFRLSQHEWHEIVDTFNVTKPMISPLT